MRDPSPARGAEEERRAAEGTPRRRGSRRQLGRGRAAVREARRLGSGRRAGSSRTARPQAELQGRGPAGVRGEKEGARAEEKG